MTITIAKEITDILPEFQVLAFNMDIQVDSSNEKILSQITEYKEKYSTISLPEILSLDRIKEGRDAYKALGKDPSRYRLAAESLLRRLSKKRDLYLINNAVDIGNLLSISLNRSTAILNYDAIVGPINIRIGRKSDEYEGIGRGKIDISNVILYEDDISPFGSTTSDTMRTRITNDTNKLLVFVICFTDTYITESINECEKMFKELGNVANFERVKVNYGRDK
ncbi:MAG: phenylalanine--tRNA ligase beta subunit-related protein [Bacilli bacterium]